MLEGFVVAQMSDPLSGGAGWIGAGLLGAVLAVVFFKIIPAVLKSHDQRVSDLVSAAVAQRSDFLGSMDRQHTAFTENLELIVQHHETQTRYLAEAFAKDMQEIRRAIEADRRSNSERPPRSRGGE